MPWLQFDSKSQNLQGLAVPPFYTRESGDRVNLTLRATDSTGQTVSSVLTIVISSDDLFKISHVFEMTIRTDFVLFTSGIEHVLWWAGNITEFFNNSIDSIRVLEVHNASKTSVIVKWTNNTINNIIPPYTCPLADILHVLNQTRSELFQSDLSQFIIQDVTLELRGVCHDFTTALPLATSTLEQTTTDSARPTTSTTTPVSIASRLSVYMNIFQSMGWLLVILDLC